MNLPVLIREGIYAISIIYLPSQIYICESNNYMGRTKLYVGFLSNSTQSDIICTKMYLSKKIFDPDVIYANDIIEWHSLSFHPDFRLAYLSVHVPSQTMLNCIQSMPQNLIL